MFYRWQGFRKQSPQVKHCRLRRTEEKKHAVLKKLQFEYDDENYELAFFGNSSPKRMQRTKRQSSEKK